MMCPICDHPHTHVEEAGIAVVDDDYTDRELITVNAETGEVRTHAEEGAVPTEDPPSRGSRIVLKGWCEGGHKFAVVFSQHKGSTLVAVQDLGPAEN